MDIRSAEKQDWIRPVSKLMFLYKLQHVKIINIFCYIVTNFGESGSWLEVPFWSEFYTSGT